MSYDSERFRTRARECRVLAEDARSPSWRDELIELANELEREADLIEQIEDRPNRMNLPHGQD